MVLEVVRHLEHSATSGRVLYGIGIVGVKIEDGGLLGHFAGDCCLTMMAEDADGEEDRGFW